jgi:plasmid stabilization system protein ParE
MSITLVVRPPAQAELVSAAEWYEQQRVGLGVEFTQAVLDAFDEIKANPKRYAQVYKDVRAAQLSKFSSYCIYYRIRGRRALVIAVFHSSRDPSIWQSRG